MASAVLNGTRLRSPRRPGTTGLPKPARSASKLAPRPPCRPRPVDKVRAGRRPSRSPGTSSLKEGCSRSFPVAIATDRPERVSRPPGSFTPWRVAWVLGGLGRKPTEGQARQLRHTRTAGMCQRKSQTVERWPGDVGAAWMSPSTAGRRPGKSGFLRLFATERVKETFGPSYPCSHEPT